MNSESQSEKSECGRGKERYVWEALEAVQKWRSLYENGYQDNVGVWVRPSLKDAAAMVGIPKKTLQQYHQLLRKIAQFTTLDRLLDKKMGYLRQLLKEFQNQTGPTEVEEEPMHPQSTSWDNMIIEADDQIAFQSEENEDYNQRKILYEEGIQQNELGFQNEEDFVKYLQFEEDQNYCKEIWENECFQQEFYFQDPALPDS